MKSIILLIILCLNYSAFSQMLNTKSGSFLKFDINKVLRDNYELDNNVKRERTQAVRTDTVKDYLDRSTGFKVYSFTDQDNSVWPLAGTNPYYHLVGVKYDLENTKLLGILAACGVKIINAPADSLGLIFATGDESTGLPTNPIIANMGFSVNDLDTNSKEPLFSPIMLNAPINVSGKIAIMIQTWTQTSESDIIALWANNQGDAKGENSSFFSIVNQQGIASYNFDQLKINMSDGKPPNFDLMILPLIEVEYTEDTTSVDYSSVNGLKIRGLYPSPVADNAVLEFSLSEPSDLQIEIMDLSGKNVKTIKIVYQDNTCFSIPLELNDLIAGNYFCLIKTDSGAAAFKFIKI